MFNLKVRFYKYFIYFFLLPNHPMHMIKFFVLYLSWPLFLYVYFFYVCICFGHIVCVFAHTKIRQPPIYYSRSMTICLCLFVWEKEINVVAADVRGQLSLFSVVVLDLVHHFVFVFVYLSVTICFCVRNSSCSGQCLWVVVIVLCRCPWFRASFCLCLCIKIVAAADVCGQLSFPLESRRRGGEMIHTVIEQ